MTTHELARKLLKGPDILVLVHGYEYGAAEVDTIENKPLELNYWMEDGDSGCGGPHEFDPYPKSDTYKIATRLSSTEDGR